jgi:hypothetical protein
MQPTTKSRPSLARIVWLGLAVSLYLSVLIFAAQVTGGDTAPTGQGGAVAMVGPTQTGLRTDMRPASPAESNESPLLTLAIAGVAVGTVQVWRVSHQTPRPRPARVRAITSARATTVT